MASAGVDGALGPHPHRAGDAHDVLAAQVGGAVDDALHDAGVVAQVDEGEVLAVLATPADPAAHVTTCADVLGRSSPQRWVRMGSVTGSVPS